MSDEARHVAEKRKENADQMNIDEWPRDPNREPLPAAEIHLNFRRSFRVGSALAASMILYVGFGHGSVVNHLIRRM